MQLVFQVISVVISILSVIFCIATFVLNRKDKAVKEAKDNNQPLIEYQLSELKTDVRTILKKLEAYDKDIDDRIDKAIETHIKIYHSKKGE